MNKHYISFLPILFLLFHCTSLSPLEETHLFYLHGRIIEVQGIDAVHETFGKYYYREIIDSLTPLATHIHHEIRTQETDFYEFAHHISHAIDSLIAQGIPPAHITVMGASKGGVMAMYISSINDHPINYVFLAANNDYIETEYDWVLKGNILGIYEQSDSLAGKGYAYWQKRKHETDRIQEVKLDTGLGHGIIYRPLGEWLDPVKQWLHHP